MSGTWARSGCDPLYELAMVRESRAGIWGVRSGRGRGWWGLTVVLHGACMTVKNNVQQDLRMRTGMGMETLSK